MRLWEYKSCKISFVFITLILCVSVIAGVLALGSYDNAGGKHAEASISHHHGSKKATPTNSSYKDVYGQLYLYADDTWGEPYVYSAGAGNQITTSSTYATAGWRDFSYETSEDSVFESGTGYTWSSSAPSSFTIRYKTGSSADSSYYSTLWSDIQGGSYSTRTVYRYGDDFYFYSDKSTYYTFKCSASTSSVMYTFVVVYLYNLSSSYFTYATFTLTYNPNGGTVSPTSVSVTYNTTYVSPPTPTRTGFNFAGWYLGSTRYTGGTWKYNSAETVKAKWTSTINLDQQSGTGGTTSITAEAGVAMPTATAPTRSGWTFSGYWTGISGTGTQYYNSSMGSVTKNDLVNGTTLYASWTGSTTLDQQGGSGGTTSISGTYAAAMPSATAPTRSGWTFGGYYTSPGGQGTLIYDASMSATGTYSYGGQTLYAKWTSTINLDQQGGSGGSSSTSGAYNTTMPTATKPSRTGWTFGGYFTGIGGAGTQYYSDSMASTHNYDLASGTTLYAKWTSTINLDLQGGDGGTTSVTGTFSTAMPAASAPTRNDYTFGGYFTSVGGAGTQYYNAQMTSTHTFDIPSGTTLYAKWATNISFNKQGGTGGSDNVNVVYGAEMPTATAPTRTGYTFGGYFTENNGNGIQFYNASMQSVKNWNLSSNVPLYALWTPNDYTITFEYNGATAENTESNKIVTFNTVYNVLPQPIKAGNVFKGWYLDSNFTTEVTSATIMTTASDHTLYAKWQTWLNIYASGSTTKIDSIGDIGDNNTSAKLTLIPEAGNYISEISFDNSVFFTIDSYSTILSDLDFAVSVTYFASTKTNQFVLDMNIFAFYFDTYDAINLYVKTISTPYTSLKKAGGNSVSGVAVSATKGGSVTIIGDEYESLADSDTITVRADICLVGYQFDGWYFATDLNKCISSEMSEKFAKSLVYENQLVAIFSPIDKSNVNDSTSNE